MADDLRIFSIDEARKIALEAQGFADPRPQKDYVDLADLERVVRRLNIVQIDSVNVLVRAQYMPFFSRLGPYPSELLHRYAYEERNLFEYPVHEASLIPLQHLPMIRHRMADWKPWPLWSELMASRPEILRSTITDIESHGPLAVSDIQDKGDRYGYWSTSTAKLVLETMFNRGELAISDRINSARRYDLFERVVPDAIADESPWAEVDAHRAMMKLAIESLGIGTVADCADYYRIKRTDAKHAIDDLVERGEVERARVEGTRHDMFVLPGVKVPSQNLDARAIVSPFDPVAWFRDRLQWLFDFEYRIEIYTPVKKRKYGYYVLPFILGDRFVARVDLKADRKASVLRVPGAFLESGQDEEYVAAHLASELSLMAQWLGLDRIVIGRRGNLTRSLRTAVKPSDPTLALRAYNSP